MEPRVQFNPFSPRFREDPYATYAELRQAQPVHRVLGVWVLTRYADNVAVLRDRRFASTVIPDLIKKYKAKTGRSDLDLIDRFIEKTIVFTENPDHTRLRRLVADEFNPPAIARERERMKRIVDRRLSALRERDEIEVVSELADPIPLEVTCERLGIPPSMHETVSNWTHRVRFLLDPGMMRPSDYEGVHDVLGEFYAYMRPLLDERRRDPRDDFLTRLLQARAGHDRLSEDELLALSVVSFVAGHETTRYLISNMIQLLVEHPDELAKVRASPDLVPSVVDEVLRYEAPLQQTKRIATADVDVGGATVRQGEQALICFGAANRDPARFPDPDRFDVTRGDKSHLGFGYGLHGCLGGTLAHVEAELVLERFLDFGRWTPASEAKDWQDHSLILRGLKHYRIRREA